jgi:hypothetical protein
MTKPLGNSLVVVGADRPGGFPERRLRPRRLARMRLEIATGTHRYQAAFGWTLSDPTGLVSAAATLRRS